MKEENNSSLQDYSYTTWKNKFLLISKNLNITPGYPSWLPMKTKRSERFTSNSDM